VGIALRERGDIDGAMNEYRAALAVEPDYHLPRVNLAWLLIERGDLAGAVEQARYVTVADPNPGPAHLALGVAFAGLGDIDGAERELRLATRDGVTRRDALLVLLDLYRQRGDRDRERAVLGALSATPPSPGRPSTGLRDGSSSP
jgi:Flp pilus assembly protein TadD